MNSTEESPETCKKMFDMCAQPCFSETNIKEALDGWCSGLVQLSQGISNPEPDTESQNRSTCRDFVKSYYAFDDNLGSVSFKPTLAKGSARLRLDEEGAIDYFCGSGDKARDEKEGNGFAKKHWQQCQAQPKSVRIDGCTATVTGTLMLENDDGETTVVDKTWSFVKSPLANPLLQLVGHHSSLQVV